MIKSILHTGVHFGLNDIGQFAKWSIYIVATMHMCKFEISKTFKRALKVKLGRVEAFIITDTCNK